MIPAEAIEAAHADLVAAGMSPTARRLPATALARWRTSRDNGEHCEIFLRAYGLPAAAIHRLMFEADRS